MNHLSPFRFGKIFRFHLNIVRRSRKPPRCEPSHFFTIIYSNCELLQLGKNEQENFIDTAIVKKRFRGQKGETAGHCSTTCFRLGLTPMAAILALSQPPPR